MKTRDNSIKINVLLCDTFPGRLPADIPTYVSMHEKLLKQVSDDVHFTVFMAMDGELPTVLSKDEIYLIPGCMYSAYDPLPWIEALQQWVRMAVAQQVFLVGICFGHQVIARALGGKVEQSHAGWGAGIRESKIIDPLMLDSFTDGTLRLLYNHHDQVTSIPDNANLLATSDFCEFEALRYGHHVYTFQGHPEYTPYYMDFYLKHLAAGQDPQVIDNALHSLSGYPHQGVDVAQWVIEMFNQYLSSDDDVG